MATRTQATDGGRLVFAATLPLDMRAAVETLFFFNPRQSQRSEGIHATVASAGMPTLATNADRVWIEVPPGRTQCLFACDTARDRSRVAGVVLFSRPEVDTIWITHLAVDPDYAYGGEHAALSVAAQLVDRVAVVARSIKGVEWIRLPYRDRRRLRVPRPDS